MSRFEFAVPKSAVGENPSITVWHEGDFIRVAVAPANLGDVSAATHQPTALQPNAEYMRADHVRASDRQPTTPRRLVSVDGGFVREDNGWSSGGVSLPAETELQFSYDDTLYHGIILDGSLFFGDEARSKSPSGAVMSAIRSNTGKVVNVNGWNYIDVLLPGSSEFVPLASFRSNVLKRTKPI